MIKILVFGILPVLGFSLSSWLVSEVLIPGVLLSEILVPVRIPVAIIILLVVLLVEVLVSKMLL